MTWKMPCCGQSLAVDISIRLCRQAGPHLAAVSNSVKRFENFPAYMPLFGQLADGVIFYNRPRPRDSRGSLHVDQEGSSNLSHSQIKI